MKFNPDCNDTMKTTLRLLITLLALTGGGVLYANDAEVSGNNAVVLLYQRFGSQKQPAYVSAEQFRNHLEYLDSNDFQVWPLERIVRRLRTGQTIPDKTVAITFDDTHPSIYEVAYPLLKQKNWPFTVFVVPDLVDQAPRSNMSWAQMREMQKNGADFANHSSNHLHLIRPLRGYPPRAWMHYIRDNILNAQARLVEEFGAGTNQARIFSYPYGEYSTALANILAELGFTSFSQHPGGIGDYADTRALPRFPMSWQNGDAESFAHIANSVALPVQDLKPWNPMVASEMPPAMTAELDKKQPAPKYLTCTTRDGHRVEVKWNNRDHSSFTLTSPAPLPAGYNHYECTSRYQNSQRLYWFSQPWILGTGGVSKGAEAQEEGEEGEAPATEPPPDNSPEPAGAGSPGATEPELPASAH